MLEGIVGVEIKPRAKLTVVTWLSSVRAFDSIFAAASELEKRGGKVGRGLGELLKNRGEGGWRSEWNPEGPKEKVSRKCRERGFESFCFLFAGSEVGARSSCGECRLRFLALLPLKLDVGGGKSEGGVLATACDTLALRPLVRLPGLCLPVPLSLFLKDVHIDVVGACSFVLGLCLSMDAFKVFARWFSGSDITSGTACAAACMRFFSRASGVLCRRKGELGRVERAGVFDRGGSRGLLNASREVKMLGLLELICGQHPARMQHRAG